MNRNAICVVLGCAAPLLGIGADAAAQYINGVSAPVTAGQLCAEVRGMLGMSRAGHTLRSVSCSGGGHSFTIHVTID